MRGLLAPLVKLIAFLVVTAMATYVLAATITNSGYGKATSYYGLFSDATGLLVGDDVRVSGVRVGSIQAIKLIREPHAPDPATAPFVARVKFSVSMDRPLTSWVRAKLRFRNLVGQRYLAIEQGSEIPGVPEQQLKPKSVIPLSQTQNALDLSTLFAGFKPLFSGLNPDEINSLSMQIIQTLQGEGGTVENLMRQTAELTSAVADKDKVIGDLVDNLSSVLDTLGQREAKLSELIVQLQRWVSGLAEDRAVIGDSITGINNLTSATAGLLDKSRPQLAQDVKDLTGLAQTLNAGNTTIDGILQRFPNKLATLTRTATYGSWFNFYLCSMEGSVLLPGGVQLTPGMPTPFPPARCR
ncbi:MAG TPA: MlaD family protein [Jatrophihabitans sp.]|nr:MlaD family protein [Jatrophihabitans sp.]